MFASPLAERIYLAVVLSLSAVVGGIALAWTIRIFRSPAPAVGSKDTQAVFAGLNRSGLKALLFLCLALWPLCWLPWRFVSCRPQPKGTSAKPGGRWIPLARRTRIVAMTLLILLVPYVGSYAWLSRRGMREAEEVGLMGFLYLPAEQVFATEDLGAQLYLVRFYAPANLLDQQLFGSPPPITNIMFRLSFDEPADPPE